MGITFFSESAAVLAHEGLPLFEEHAREQVHSDLPLDLDLDAYQRADFLGILRVYTVRDAGVLVGYGVYAVTYSWRHRTSLQATQDSLYLIPPLRGRTVGVRFMNFIESALRSEGVQVLRQHTHPGTAMDGIMARLGYEHAHNEWELRLDKE